MKLGLKQFFLSMCVFSISVSLMASEKVNKSFLSSVSAEKQKSKMDFDAKICPEIIKDIYRKVKKVNQNSEEYKICLDLTIKVPKYRTQLKTFWDEVVKKTKDGEKITRATFSNTLENIDEDINVNDIKKSCKNVLDQENLMDADEIDNEKKQGELKRIIEPFVERKQAKRTGKNIITAFLGPHKNEESSPDFYKKLNGSG